MELTDGPAELGPPRLWEEKTTIRGAPRSSLVRDLLPYR